MLELEEPFYYDVENEDSSSSSYMRSGTEALHASSLMTAALESFLDDESSGRSGDGSSVINVSGSSQENEDVVVDDGSDGDGVVFLGSLEGNNDVSLSLQPMNTTTHTIFKPFNVVKPFGFASRISPEGESEDEIVVVDEDKDESEDCFRKSFEGLQKEYNDKITESTDDFLVPRLCEDSPDLPKRVQLKLEAISEETIYNYTLVKECYVCIQRFRPKQAKRLKKRRSSDSDDPSYFPDERNGPTRDLSVYQNIPLNRNERNRSKITFCDRVMDLVECIKNPSAASELCSKFWGSLSIRTKRKYLPRSKYPLCANDGDDPRVRMLTEL